MTPADLIAKHRAGEAVTDADKMAEIGTAADLDIFTDIRTRFGGISPELWGLIHARRREIGG